MYLCTRVALSDLGGRLETVFHGQVTVHEDQFVVGAPVGAGARLGTVLLGSLTDQVECFLAVQGTV